MSRLRNIRWVSAWAGLSLPTLHRMRRAGLFPQPLVLSPGRVGWREDDLEAWASNLLTRAELKTEQPTRAPSLQANDQLVQGAPIKRGRGRD
jgi:predicted DNA-binding transcriptional regulator AlpA